MKTRKTKAITQNPTFKGELVPEKDSEDNDPTGRYTVRNPYKTPPNSLSTKGRR